MAPCLVTPGALREAFRHITSGGRWALRITAGLSALVALWNKGEHCVIKAPRVASDLTLVLFVFFQLLLNGGAVNGKVLARFEHEIFDEEDAEDAFQRAVGFPLVPLDMMRPDQVVVYTIFALGDHEDEQPMAKFRREHHLWQDAKTQSVTIAVAKLADDE